MVYLVVVLFQGGLYMKYHTIANTDLHVSNLIMGNMRLTELSLQEAEKLIRTAMEEEINFLIMLIFTVLIM